MVRQPPFWIRFVSICCIKDGSEISDLPEKSYVVDTTREPGKPDGFAVGRWGPTGCSPWAPCVTHRSPIAATTARKGRVLARLMGDLLVLIVTARWCSRWTSACERRPK